MKPSILFLLLFVAVPVVAEDFIQTEHLEAYLEAAKEQAIQPLQKELAELRSGRTTAEKRTKIRKLNQQIDTIKKHNVTHMHHLKTDLHRMRSDEVGYVSTHIEVLSIIDETQFIALEKYTKTLNGRPYATYSNPIWFKGFDTSKLSDGKLYAIRGVYEAIGTENYTSAIGTRITATVIQLWTPNKDKK